MTGRIAAAPWIILAVLVASRAWVWSLGIGPNPAFLLDHWQFADLQLLSAEPLRTIWLFHAQPPLFNLLIAGFAWVVGPDPLAIAWGLLALNIVLTFAVALQIEAILRCLDVGGRLALAAAIGFTLLPWVIYYENFPFYPHLTLFLVTTFLFFVTRYRSSRRVRDLAFAALALVLLSWTWSVFHPIAVALLLGGVMAVCGAFSRTGLVTVAAALVLSGLPTVKNLVLFEAPASSSWLGLNAAQTVGLDQVTAAKCSFESTFRDIETMTGLPQEPAVLYASRKSDGSQNANHVLFLERSAECLAAFKASLLRDVPGYAAGIRHALVRSHSATPDQYYLTPLGWKDTWPFSALRQDGPLAGLLFAYTVLFVAMVAFAVRSPQSWFFRVMLGLVLYFELVTHAFNGGEQERMRHTIEVAYFLTLVFTLNRLAAKDRTSQAS